MHEEEFSLPPLLNDSIQGRLDFIFLRPSLIPSLLSNQVLELHFSWWGSSYLHNVKLLPEADEVKIVFNIRCDYKGLLRYFDDSPDLEVHITVSQTQSDGDKAKQTKTVSKKPVSPQCRYTRYQLKNKREWKSGDYVGKFVIKGLEFNGRGEFVNEFSIINSHEDNCGSIVVFMLHTDHTSRNISIPNDKELKPEPTNVPTNTQGLSDFYHSQTHFPKENLSPRFIPLEKTSKDLPKLTEKKAAHIKPSPNRTGKQTQKPILKNSKAGSYSSPKKERKGLFQQESKHLNTATASPPILLKPKLNTKEFKTPASSLNRHAAESMFSSLFDCDASHLDQNFIIARLFSFVDCGAISRSDLPTLIQICQGRSPSIDFESHELVNVTGHESFQDGSLIPSKDPTLPPSLSREGYSMVNKGKKGVSFSGISYHSDSLILEEPQKMQKVFDEKFFASLRSESDIVFEGALSSKKFENDDEHSRSNFQNCEENRGFEIKDKTETDNSPIVSQQTSLCLMTFHSIRFPTEDPNGKFAGKKCKEKTVRQRSKLCYFIEVCLDFEETEKDMQSTLYVSRRLDNEEVVFGERQNFQLPQSSENSFRNKGYFKFKVSKRKLGNRMRDHVGVAILSLERLLTCDEKEVSVVLPLWPTNSTEALKETTKKEFDNAIGTLHFTLTFAITMIPQLIDNGNLEIPERDQAHNVRQNFKEERMISEGIPQRLDKMKEFKLHCSRYPSSFEETADPSELHRVELRESFINNGSLVIENCSSVNFVPFGQNDVKANISKQEVHMEIIKANGLPELRRKGIEQAFPPSTYVQITLSSSVYRTQIVKCSSLPEWNYATDLIIALQDLLETNLHIVLKVFHSLNGSSPHSNDVMLGFATVDTQFLWNSFVSLCGWIPVFNLEGKTCGELKISLTPKKRKSILNPFETKFYLSSTQDDEKKPLTADVREKSETYSDFKVSDSSSNTNIDSRTDTRKFSNGNDQKMLTAFEKTRLRNYSPSSETQSSLNNPQPGCKSDLSLKLVKPSAQSEETFHSYSRRRGDNGSNSPIRQDFLENHKVESKSEMSVTKVLPQVIEGLQWMNHASSFDTPCVSYLDLGPTSTELGTSRERQRGGGKRKIRIAAKLNFS